MKPGFTFSFNEKCFSGSCASVDPEISAGDCRFVPAVNKETGLCSSQDSSIVILNISSTYTVLTLQSSAQVINPNDQCQENGFSFESGSYQAFFLLSCQGVFPWPCRLGLTRYGSKYKSTSGYLVCYNSQCKKHYKTNWIWKPTVTSNIQQHTWSCSLGWKHTNPRVKNIVANCWHMWTASGPVFFSVLCLVINLDNFPTRIKHEDWPIPSIYFFKRQIGKSF